MQRLGKTLAVVALLPFLCGAATPPTLYTFRHPAMGTEFSLYLYSGSEAEAKAIADEAFDEVDRIEQELSNYRDSSELSRINRQAAASPVTTDPETFSFLKQSQHWSEASDGAFDITVGPLMKSWGFFRSKGRIPPAEELERLRAVVGYKNMELDADARTVHFRVPGVELDPGGIGKGFAVDAVVVLLRSRHVKAALISAGSSTLYGLGSPPHEAGWKVVVPGPDHAPLSTVSLRDTSLSSANCSEKNFVVDGHLYCHIMDPRTLRPVEGRIQVSIVDPSATTSDALSNVLFVDTPEQSAAFLARYAPEGRALIVSGRGGKAGCSTFRWPANVSKDGCPLGHWLFGAAEGGFHATCTTVRFPVTMGACLPAAPWASWFSKAAKSEHGLMNSNNNGIAENSATKERSLLASLRSTKRLMVAYSGGADSAYLAFAAYQALGDEMLAVIADSPSLPRAELKSAIDFAESHHIPLRIVQTHEMDDAAYVRNDSKRCFRCKDELFSVMSSLRGKLGFEHIAYGMNVDDRGDFRPGQKAAANHQVLAPLADARLTKDEIRSLSRQHGLATWDKPAAACLSSRVAYGLPVTHETLTSVERGEAVLAGLGFRQFRVRHHGDLARIEIAREEMPRMLSTDLFGRVSAALKVLGYKFVTLDMEGFRSGSMNSVLPADSLLPASEIRCATPSEAYEVQR
jgi:thiamine biosynthesis lipoprotein